MGDLNPGEKVLDLGCGAGFDSLIAAREVGASGRVISIDMTPAMLEKARVGAREAGVSNVEFYEAYAESLPVPDESIDVVISNGVINLCPDKMAVLQEINRVLKPGGRIQIGDIVVHKTVPDDAKADIDLWRDWIAGALLEAEWDWALEHSGFASVSWGKQIDVFSGSKHESSAAEFETRGVTIAARKAS
jgi:arsenite methyltransferase